ncbi:MAG: hypothetical protein O3B99_00720 [Proteobacteria bacterium]|nr:hypothetical protein [Pseudomonadota bacterium]MDA1320799.1 hypothetical protein [Pseudomonadota bacterium]
MPFAIRYRIHPSKTAILHSTVGTTTVNLMDHMVEVARGHQMVATPVGANLTVRAADQGQVDLYRFATNGMASPISITRTFP